MVENLFSQIEVLIEQRKKKVCRGQIWGIWRIVKYLKTIHTFLVWRDITHCFSKSNFFVKQRCVVNFYKTRSQLKVQCLLFWSRFSLHSSLFSEFFCFWCIGDCSHPRFKMSQIPCLGTFIVTKRQSAVLLLLSAHSGCPKVQLYPSWYGYTEQSFTLIND